MTEEFWTTKTGERIAVGDMDEDHVRNVLRYLIRKKNNEDNPEDLGEIGIGFGDYEFWK